MTKQSLSAVFVFGALCASQAMAAPRPAIALPHSTALPREFDLEMTGQEYLPLIQKMKSLRGAATDPTLDPAMQMGKLNLDWITHINQHRDADHQLSFSSKETQAGYPIDKPKLSNPTIVMKAFTDLKAGMPEEMRKVLFEGAPFTDDVPIAEADYLTWGRNADNIYQSASRWLLESPYLSDYTDRQLSDIRGFYYLGLEQDLKTKLDGWSALASADQARFTDLLVGLCLNSASSMSAKTQCQSALKKAITGKTVDAFYQSYLTGGQAMWDSYFYIVETRDDVSWSARDPGVMSVPFRTVDDQKVLTYLGNIEDEWHTDSWQLKLDFRPDAEIHLVYEAGATPHVDSVAGSTITMDANAPLTEFAVQWAIRHEYGHTLGFPDCYTEFYDPTQKVMVSYQLDVTDLMCSRQGHFKQRHFDDLKKHYLK